MALTRVARAIRLTRMLIQAGNVVSPAREGLSDVAPDGPDDVVVGGANVAAVEGADDADVEENADAFCCSEIIPPGWPDRDDSRS